MKPTLLSYSGRVISLKNPEPDQFSLIDIAHGLSRQFRYNGLTVKPYTVAQHSTIVARMCTDPKSALLAMLHDASEAYLHDIPTPLKQILPDYRKIERKVQEAIEAGLIWDGFFNSIEHAEKLYAEVSEADKLALRHEVSTIVLHREEYGLPVIPPILQVQELREQNILNPDEAFVQFLKDFDAILLTIK